MLSGAHYSRLTKAEKPLASLPVCKLLLVKGPSEDEWEVEEPVPQNVLLRLPAERRM